MGKKKKRNRGDEDIRIYPGSAGYGGAGNGKPATGAFETQAITDPTNRFHATKAARPSDLDVEENRNWVNQNQK